MTKPPRLEIDTERILCKAKVGQQLTKLVTISTKESRFVYAQAWSKHDWIKAGPAQSQGDCRHDTFAHQGSGPSGGNSPHRCDLSGERQPAVCRAGDAGRRGRQAARETPAPQEAAGRLQLRGLCAVLAAIPHLRGRHRRAGPEPPRQRRSESAARREQRPAATAAAAAAAGPRQKEAWWDSLPDSKLAASAAALKECSPEHSERLLTASRSIRMSSATKRTSNSRRSCPNCCAIPKSRERLGRFVTDCCVFEPSELCTGALAAGADKSNSAGPRRISARGERGKTERALFSAAGPWRHLGHKAIHPERAKSLANDLGTVFGFALDTSAAPDELMDQAEKLLAMRYYRNTLPTAKKSIEHALLMHAVLIEKFPKYLTLAFRATGRHGLDRDRSVQGQ